ncbi:fAD binding domain-containing protein [Clostridium sp. CAG:678]|nr:fAD binding domain-containing protein [Clostridium sp. CAG:678]
MPGTTGIVMKRDFIKTDAVIVGSGVAGLFAALCLPESKKVLVITKEDLKECDSYLAQGGVCVLKDIKDFDCYFEDTMRAGHYENNPESVRVMIESSPDVISTLIQLGVQFDTDSSGSYDYTREGAHRRNRILHHKDETGKEITATLLSIAKKRKNITFIAQTTMIDLIEKDNICYGIVCEDEYGERGAILAKDIILATGGIGGLFKNSTNFPHITGDAFALALKHGIEMKDMNYIQIHPTTLYSKKSGRRFLISESVRGEGAILLNENGERFTDELQPRDVVTDAICKEMEKFGTDHVYITLPTMTSEQAQKRFPNIFEACMEEGYDITKDKVPVTPGQHYMMGGIKTDINGRTSMAHLFAVGETACNGVHGKNRLASNSLLESMVFSKRAADLIAKDSSEKETYAPQTDWDSLPPKAQREKEFRDLIMNEIKRKDRAFYDKWCNDED